MNAYELADALDWVCENHLIGIGDADFKTTANMLRHQADRIAELENQLDKCSHHEAMAHQGGYEIGYAEGLKKASEK